MTDRSGDWTKPGSFVGNGPFILEEWQLNRHLVARKNPLYHSAAQVRLNAVHFLPIESTEAEERAFRAATSGIGRTPPKTSASTPTWGPTISRSTPPALPSTTSACAAPWR